MKIKISLPNNINYDVNIEKLKKLSFDRKVAIVTNSTVSSLHLSYLLNCIEAKELSVVTLEDGEQYKNMQSIETILSHCFENRFDRKSLLISFGGGVIGDMTGFAASIYQRGIDFMQIPTTLLSQVDASVGGKTGINNKFGKNLIGTFHQPVEVNIDPYFLGTLPKREFSAGLAEVIKMAVTFDKEFFEFLEKNDLDKEENIIKIIAKSVQIKAKVVNEDEKEQGIRAALNYGHTFAHVIENETNYIKYLHGEAVGIGMIMANKLAVNLGILSKDEDKRIKNLLQKYNIPTDYKIQNIERFYEQFFLDKKSANNKIKFILPKKIGDFIIKNEIKKEQVLAVLKEFEN